MFKILSIYFIMRKYLFITLATALFTLSANADDGLSVKSFRWKDGDYVGDATKNMVSLPSNRERNTKANGSITSSMVEAYITT